MSNQTTVSWIWNIIPQFITSYPSQMMQGLYQPSFMVINFLIQGIFFSGGIINFISSIAVVVGLSQSGRLIKKKWMYYVLVIMFFWLNLWEISNEHSNVLKVVMYVTGFYISICAVQGCFYVKQKINRMDHEDAYENSNEQHRSSMIKQVFLISLTLVSVFLFIFIWYNLNLAKNVSNRIKQQTKIIPIIIISNLLIFSISILRKISLLYPLIICCFFLQFTIFIRILFDVVIYVAYPKLYNLGIPFQSFIFIIFAIEGKERHKKQVKRKQNKMLVEEMFWACAMFYLYFVAHGNVIYVQYMVVVIYIWQALRKSIY